MELEHYNLFTDGKYKECIEKSYALLYQTHSIDYGKMILDCEIRRNNTSEISNFANRMLLAGVFSSNVRGMFQMMEYIRSNNVCQMSILTEDIIRNMEYTPNQDHEFNIEKGELDTDDELMVFPMTWPLAYGDFLVINQFIKRFKENNPTKKTLVICPLNRRELREVLDMNTGVDAYCDITLMPEEEKDRSSTISLFNEDWKCFNLIAQEVVIYNAINTLKDFKHVSIYKMRYFPTLSFIESTERRTVHNTFRIWEERARLFLENWGEELPKLVDDYQKPKKDKIVLHFREGDYGDLNRNLTTKEAQAIIYALKESYPGYELVRIGDTSMSDLKGVTDGRAFTLQEQIAHMQEAKLFIGSHSAPQHAVVAFSDTPVICTHYAVQHTCIDMAENSVAKHSLEPIGAQVRAILYNKAYIEDGTEVPPSHTNPAITKIVHPTLEDLMEQVHLVLGSKE